MRRSDLAADEAFRLMLRMRLVELTLAKAWEHGLVPGEYHSGIGEEGINAGVLMHLSRDDSVSLDHRCTSPMIARGADPAALMLEVLGFDEGMNQGRAGHMHLMAPSLRAAADGIVGSSAPLAVGNAIAHKRLRPGRVAVAFHGEAAMNQGMLMEAYNLAVAWELPVVFVCKDNKWSITTYSRNVTGGDPPSRARSFGLAVEEVNGASIQQVHAAAGSLVDRARKGRGPGFLHATCHRPGGHFEGDPIVRILRDPTGQAQVLAPGIAEGAAAEVGAARAQRAEALKMLTQRLLRAKWDWSNRRRMDPLRRLRRKLDNSVASAIETDERRRIEKAVATARVFVRERPTFGVQPGSST